MIVASRLAELKNSGEPFPLILQRQTDRGRVYLGLGSFEEFPKLLNSTSPADRNFFEVIAGDKVQKPHFDVDMQVDPQSGKSSPDGVTIDEVISALLKAIDGTLTILGHFPTTADQRLIFTSHGETKRSVHVIIDGYHHAGNLEARNFFEMVKKRILPREAQYLDQGVYSSTQHFRTIWSTKRGANRPKIPLRDYPEITLRSLVSKVGPEKSTLILTGISPTVERKKLRAKIPDDLAENIVNRIETWLEEIMPEFQVRELKDNCIVLDRITPAKCKICLREHHNENSYLTFRLNNGIMEVKYFCWRASRGSHLSYEISLEPIENVPKPTPATRSEMIQKLRETASRLKFDTTIRENRRLDGPIRLSGI